MNVILIPVRFAMDVLINAFFWAYFTLGFILFLMPLYFAAYLIGSRPEASFQRLNYWFYRVFFALSRLMIPGLTITIGPGVRDIRSSVIICNHISYIDPILIISLFSRQKTIVKKSIFMLPVFGWFLRNSGYISYGGDDTETHDMTGMVEKLREYFQEGGNLFVFPEGTRMTGGQIGKFHKGAFSLARRCKAPVAILRITNTDRLMKPGNLWYSTCFRNPVSVELLATIAPDYSSDSFSLKGLITQARTYYTGP